MSRIIVLIVGIVGFSINSLAATEWFYAGFTGFGDLDTVSRGGHWRVGDAVGAVFDNEQLELGNIEESKPVAFVANVKRNGYWDSLVLTVESVITCYGYDEMPKPPSGSDVKSAVIAMDSGELYVLGYDNRGGTNRWFATGCKAPFGSEIKVRATFAYSNVQNSVVYEFNGKPTSPFPIRNSEIQSVGYVGSGEVEELSAEYGAAPEKVRMIMPNIAGITVTLSTMSKFEYPGVKIVLYFSSSQGTVSRTSAYYRVQSDGSLEFADTGRPPYLLSEDDLKYPEFIRDESDELRSRYDNWATANGVATADADEMAYLLNCRSAEVDEAVGKFMIISIKKVEGEWVVKVTGDKGEGDRYGNGYVHIKSVRGTLIDAPEGENDFFQAIVQVSPP